MRWLSLLFRRVCVASGCYHTVGMPRVLYWAQKKRNIEKPTSSCHVNIHTPFSSSISRTFSEGMRPAVAGFLSTGTMWFSICPTRVVGRRRALPTERLAALFSDWANLSQWLNCKLIYFVSHSFSLRSVSSIFFIWFYLFHSLGSCGKPSNNLIPVTRRSLQFKPRSESEAMLRVRPDEPHVLGWSWYQLRFKHFDTMQIRIKILHSRKMMI